MIMARENHINDKNMIYAIANLNIHECFRGLFVRKWRLINIVKFLNLSDAWCYYYESKTNLNRFDRFLHFPLWVGCPSLQMIGVDPAWNI